MQRRTGVAPHRIDIHHHLLPPRYVAETLELRPSDRSPPWSPETSIEHMDAHGIAVSVLSLMQPQVWFGDVALGRRLARESNEYAAQTAADHPGRFGVFATLSLPDVDGSLREVEYALDVLKADGFGLMTSYDRLWMGAREFWPVMEELNRRQAVVYTHPLAPACCKNMVPGVPNGIVELTADTTRTIASLLFSGTAARFPDIRWIFSHGGGAMPFLLGRFFKQEAALKERQTLLPKGLLYEIRRFHYELAQAHHEGALAAILRNISISQLMFGSDFPYQSAADTVDGLAAWPFTEVERGAIDCDNALTLMPQLLAGKEPLKNRKPRRRT